MLVQVRRGGLAAFLLLAMTGQAALGTCAYLLLRGVPDAGAASRLRAEELLFLTVVLCLVEAAVFVALFRRNLHVLKELDKVIDLARYGSSSFDNTLRRLGPLGERVRAINLRLGELNRLKTLRISALSAANAFLVDKARMPLLLIDVAGRIGEASPEAASRLGAGGASLKGRNLSELLPELDFAGIVSRLEKERTAVVAGRGKEANAFYPILNRDSELADVVCVLGQSELASDTTRRRDETARVTGRLHGLLRRYLRSRR